MMNSPATSVLDARDRKAMGAVLSRARASAGMTQRQLATVTGIPQGKISRIERGATAVPIQLLAQFADACGQRMQVVLSPVDDREDEAEASFAAVRGVETRSAGRELTARDLGF